MRKIKDCIICGKPHRNIKYCSPACRQQPKHQDTKRVCSGCGEVKDIEQFSKAATVKGIIYRRYRCIQCYSKFKQSRKGRIKQWYNDIKKMLKCSRCGNDDYRVLDFHHIDRETKFETVSQLVQNAASEDTIMEEIDKCEPVCANCHRIITWNENNGN